MSNLTASLCQGQPYNEAANMMGSKSGVAARFLKDNSVEVAVQLSCEIKGSCGRYNWMIV